MDRLTIAIDWLDQGFRTRDSDLGTLAMVAIAFFALFLVSWLSIALVESAVLKRRLPWSRALLALLVAATFWGSAAVIIGDTVGALAGRRAAFRYMIFEPRALPGLLIGPLLFNPVALLGLLTLLFYLYRPALPRLVLVLIIITTMAGASALELVYNHHPELTRS